MSNTTAKNAPVTLNPGGALEPHQVVGRDGLIADCWRTLAHQSVALLAPRRIGKTSILIRMAATAPEGFVVIRRDLEGVESVAEFAQLLFEDVSRLLGGWRSTASRARAYIDKLAIEASHIKIELRGLGWKRLLERLFEDLDEQLAARDETLVLMWDEITLFVAELLRRNQADDAMTLLDMLRAVRQRHARVRMMLAGSIGFEEILRRLRTHGYRNRPLNDVHKCFVPLLDDPGAEQLIRGLLRYADTDQDPALIDAMLRLSEGHPFVIQLLADRLIRLPDPRAEHVEPCLNQLLEPPGDPLDLSHYLERIDQQFDDRRAELARDVLDQLATVEHGIERNRLIEALSVHDPEAVRAVIRQLEDDFYLRRDGSRMLFMLDLVRRYWRAERSA